MTIPSGSNHIMFYLSCKAKGVKVRSKFIGVYLNLNNKSPSWMARLQGADKLYFERFPFNEQGEIDASKAYLNFHKLAGTKPRYEKKKATYKYKP